MPSPLPRATAAHTGSGTIPGVTELALAAAVLAMLVNSAASLLEAEGSRRVRPGRPLATQPRYVGGLLLDGLGWVLSVVALRALPVVTVQSVLAGAVAVTTVAGRAGRVRDLPRRSLAGVLAVVAGLVLVAAAAQPGRPAALPAAAVPVLLAAAVVALLALEPVRRSGTAVATAAAAGLAYGGVALSVRALHVRSAGWGSVAELAAEPLAYGVLTRGDRHAVDRRRPPHGGGGHGDRGAGHHPGGGARAGRAGPARGPAAAGLGAGAGGGTGAHRRRGRAAGAGAPGPLTSYGPGVDRPRVVLSRRLPEAAVALLADVADVVAPEVDRPLDAGELRAAVAGADALVCLLLDRVDDALLDAAGPQLRVVANIAVGYDNVDVEACRRRGVRVTNTPGVLTDATADLTLALLLGITLRVGEGDRLLRTCRSWGWDLDFLLGTGLRGARLGLVGYGAIGQAVAHRATAFGMDVAYAARRPAGPGAPPAEHLPLADLLAGSDVVSLHCPLTPGTRHLVDAAALRAMRSGAYLVNTARGPVMDEAALVAALEAGEIRGAALDVFEDEPAVHPGLVGRDDVLLTPHLGSATRQTREAMAVLAARNAVAVLSGQEPPTPVG